MRDLSVVIVNYNVCDLLRDCLASVFASTGVSFDVWVVDNASADGSAEMVRQEFPEARLIASPVNHGYARGNNIALRAILEDPDGAGLPRHILLLNPDTVVPPDAFATMVEYLDTHPRAGIVGPKLVRQDGRLDLACRRSFPTPEIAFYRMLGLSQLFPGNRRFGRYNLTFLDPDETHAVDSVVGAFMLLRTAAIQQAGILDEAFFMYGEDLDWAYRVKQRGWQVIYYPAVTVLHLKGQSSRQARARTTREFYRAMLIFYRKHYAPQTKPLIHYLVLSGIYVFGSAALARNWVPIGRR